LELLPPFDASPGRRIGTPPGGQSNADAFGYLDNQAVAARKTSIYIQRMRRSQRSAPIFLAPHTFDYFVLRYEAVRLGAQQFHKQPPMADPARGQHGKQRFGCDNNPKSRGALFCERRLTPDRGGHSSNRSRMFKRANCGN